MATRFRAQFPTLLGETYRIDIDDTSYAGSVTDVTVDPNGFSLTWDGDTDHVSPGIMGSGCSVSILVEVGMESIIDAFALDLISSEESRFRMAVYKISAGPTTSLFWAGFLVPDLGDFDDIGGAYYYTVKAVDGLARLKSTDYKDTTLTPDGPYGALSFLQHLGNCLLSVGTESYWGGSEVWLRTVVNWSESGMPSPAANIDPLKYSRANGSVFAKTKNTTSDAGYEFFSMLKVLETLCLHWHARLLQSDGCWRFEQVRERMEEHFFERRYSTALGLLSSTNAAGYDALVLQTGADNRLSGGQFSYLPALKKTQVKYVHNTYVNQVDGQEYRWQKDSSYSTLLFSVTGISFDSDSFFKVSGVLNIDVSVTYTKPWRAVFGILLRLPEHPYRIKSLTSISQLTPNAPIYSINRKVPTWETVGGEYYEVSTQVITSSNYKDSIPFSFWTPFIPAGEKGFEINFAGLQRGELVDGDPTAIVLNDWSMKNLVVLISGLDTASNFEAERQYQADNVLTGNSDALPVETVFGHAVKPWTPTRIEVTTDLSNWNNSTGTWDRGSETENEEFGQLLANQMLRVQQLPVQTYNGSLLASEVNAHDRIVFPDDSTWLMVRAEFSAKLNRWSVEMLKTGVADGTDIDTDTPIGIPSPEIPGVNTSGLAVSPGSGLGTLTSQSDRGRSALALLTGNYVRTAIPAGTVTTIPVDLPIKGNAYGDGDLIAVVDPQSGTLIPFIVDGDQPAGATTINVVSTVTDYAIPVGAQVVYSPMNLLTDEGGTALPGMPAGLAQGQILRWDHTNKVWVPYSGSADNHVLTWDPTNGWQSEAPPGGGGGTVSSVGLSLPAIFAVSGSPVTTTGTLTGTLATQAANTGFMGPTTGGAAAPTFRALVAADIPNLDAAKITTGTFGIARGGTGLSSLGSAAQLIRVNASATALEYFTPSFLTANQTITLSGDVTGSGSTGITTTISAGAVTYAKIQNVTSQRVLGRNAGINGVTEEVTVTQLLDWVGSTTGSILYRGAVNWSILSPGTSGQVLQTNGAGTNPSWATVAGGVSGSGSAGHIAYWTGTSNLSFDSNQLFWDATNNKLGIGTNTPAAYVHIAVPTGTSDEGLRILGNLSANLNTTISNANNASTGANTLLNIAVGGSAAGDPVVQFSISGAQTWAVGVDNSDSDKFKISAGSTPGSNDRVIVATTGEVGIGTTVLTAKVNVAGPGTTSATYSMLVNNNSASTVLSVRDDLRVGINTTSPTQELHVNGDVIARQYMNTSAPPTVTYGTGAGTGPSTGNLGGGVNWVTFSFTTGTSPVANGDIFVMTTNQAYTNAVIATFSPWGNTQTATDITKFYISSFNTNSFTMKANGTLPASTTYGFHIHIGGY